MLLCSWGSATQVAVVLNWLHVDFAWSARLRYPHHGRAAPRDAKVEQPPANRRSQFGEHGDIEHTLFGAEQAAVVGIGEDRSAPLSVAAVPRHDVKVDLSVDVHQERMVVLVGLKPHRGRCIPAPISCRSSDPTVAGGYHELPPPPRMTAQHATWSYPSDLGTEVCVGREPSRLSIQASASRAHPRHLDLVQPTPRGRTVSPINMSRPGLSGHIITGITRRFGIKITGAVLALASHDQRHSEQVPVPIVIRQKAVVESSGPLLPLGMAGSESEQRPRLPSRPLCRRFRPQWRESPDAPGPASWCRLFAGGPRGSG